MYEYVHLNALLVETTNNEVASFYFYFISSLHFVWNHATPGEVFFGACRILYGLLSPSD